MSDRKFIPEGQQKPTTNFEVKDGFHYYDGKLESFTDAVMRVNNYHKELWTIINKNNRYDTTLDHPNPRRRRPRAAGA